MDLFRSPPLPDRRLDRIGDAAAHLRATLDTAEALVAARRVVDLAGLDALAGKICAQCLDLPDDQRAEAAGLLATLLDRLDVLETTLRAAAA